MANSGVIVVIAVIAVLLTGFGFYYVTTISPSSSTSTIYSTITQTTTVMISASASSGSTKQMSNQGLTIQTLSFNETASGSSNYEYNTLIKNAGESSISGNLKLGFVSSTGQILANSNCALPLPLESGQSFQCLGVVSVNVINGDTLTLEVVPQNGSIVTYGFKVSVIQYSSPTLTSATLYGGTENAAIGQPVSSASFEFAISNLGNLNTTITG